MAAHSAIAYGKAWQQIWGTDLDQGVGKLRHEHEEEGPMGDIVKNRLKEEGGPQCGLPGVPQWRGGIGAHPGDMWDFAGLQHTQQAPHTLRLVRLWMEFLENNRPPREWCRSVLGTGVLHEEGYGSTVLYRKGTNAPSWLQIQADSFNRMVHHLDERANSRDGPDANGVLRATFPVISGGRFGRGGPGSHPHDVFELVRRCFLEADRDAFIIDYVATLNPEITPFDITNTSRGPVSRSKHEWLEILTPAYNLVISDYYAYARSSRVNPDVLE